MKNTTENHISFPIFCYGCFSGGKKNKIMKAFFQNKMFKAFGVIGLALKSLAGIGIKSYYQTHTPNSLSD